MKRLFAALIIFMILVLASCSMEVGMDSPLIKTHAVIGEGKSLKVTGYQALSYEYKLECSYTLGEESYGEVAEYTAAGSLSSSGVLDLGFISQGLWTLSVRGKTPNGSVAAEGTATAYIAADGRNNFNLALTPAEGVYGNLVLGEIKVQAIDQTGGTTLRATLRDVTGNIVAIGKTTKTNLQNSPIQGTLHTKTLTSAEMAAYGTTTSTFADYVSYNTTFSDVPVGSHTLVIEMMAGNDLLSSYIMSVTIYPGADTTVSGIMSPTGFVNLVSDDIAQGKTLPGELKASRSNTFGTLLGTKGQTSLDKVIKVTNGKIYLRWESEDEEITGVDFYVNNTKINSTKVAPSNGVASVEFNLNNASYEGYYYFSAVSFKTTGTGNSAKTETGGGSLYNPIIIVNN